MAFLQRIRMIVRSWLRTRRGRAADPGRQVAAMVEEMAEAVREAKLAAARTAADASRLQRTCDRTAAEADEWTRRAAAALAKEREDLATEAVKQEAALRKAAEGLRPAIASLLERAADLYAQVQALEQRLTEARLRLAELRMREDALASARTVGRVREQMADPYRTSGLDRLDHAIGRWEAEVGTQEVLELDPMQAKLRYVDRHLAEVEQRLAELRRMEKEL